MAESDGSSETEDEEPEESDPEPQWRAMYEAMIATPPAWIRAVGWGFTIFLGLVFALIVFVQWAVWIVVGIGMWDPWGAILGVAVCAAQILALFGLVGKTEGACEIPKGE